MCFRNGFFLIFLQTLSKKPATTNSQKNIAKTVVDNYQLKPTQTQKASELEEENKRLRIENEKLKSMLIRGEYYSEYLSQPNHLTQCFH